MTKVIVFEDGAGGLLSINPAYDNRSRLRIIVREEEKATLEHPARFALIDVLDERGQATGAKQTMQVEEAKTVEYVSRAAEYRLETDEEVEARAAASVPPGSDFAVFELPVSTEQLAERFPSAAASLYREMRTNIGKMLRQLTRERIEAGFMSAALGEAHFYPSNETDQQNLTANVVSSILPEAGEEWSTLQLCANEGGEWAYRPHTAAQIQQVGRDGKAKILACLTNAAALRAKIEAAADPTTVDLGVGWP